MTRAPLYFDHNACTPVDSRVLACFIEVETACPGNAGSLHGAGRRARSVLEAARERVAVALGVPSADVFFVASGTEANNIVTLGAGRRDRPVLLAPLEHPSVLAAAAERGSLWWEIDADAATRVTAPASEVGLMCMAHAQSEVGTLQPVAAAAELAIELGVPLHVDAAQTLGRVDLADVLRRARTVAFSAHKVGGLRGCSVLVARDGGAGVRPLMFGGGQERALRPGTPSPSLAAATALAIALAAAEWAERAAAMRAARDAFLAALDIDARVLTPADAIPNTSMVLFDDVDGRLLLPALDTAGVFASQGSACSSGSPTPPRVLTAMRLGEDDARRCVRFSFSWHDTCDDARDGAQRVNEVVRRLRASRAR